MQGRQRRRGLSLASQGREQPSPLQLRPRPERGKLKPKARELAAFRLSGLYHQFAPTFLATILCVSYWHTQSRSCGESGKRAASPAFFKEMDKRIPWASAYPSRPLLAPRPLTLWLHFLCRREMRKNRKHLSHARLKVGKGSVHKREKTNIIPRGHRLDDHSNSRLGPVCSRLLL